MWFWKSSPWRSTRLKKRKEWASCWHFDHRVSALGHVSWNWETDCETPSGKLKLRYISALEGVKSKLFFSHNAYILTILMLSFIYFIMSFHRAVFKLSGCWSVLLLPSSQMVLLSSQVRDCHGLGDRWQCTRMCEDLRGPLLEEFWPFWNTRPCWVLLWKLHSRWGVVSPLPVCLRVPIPSLGFSADRTHPAHRCVLRALDGAHHSHDSSEPVKGGQGKSWPFYPSIASGPSEQLSKYLNIWTHRTSNVCLSMRGWRPVPRERRRMLHFSASVKGKDVPIIWRASNCYR